MNKCSVWFVFLLALAGCDKVEKTTDSGAAISFLRELGGDAAGFQRACAPVQFEFPGDHGAHEQFRNEWWYVTGNLVDANQQRYGFQLTLFRIANQPQQHQSLSAWASSQFYMAHFAISAASADAISHHERFARSAVGLAGAQTEPVNIWLEDWSLRQTVDNSWQLRAAADGDNLNLTLRPSKPIVLHGDRGYSRKSDDPCNASYYYSYTRMKAQGTLSVHGQTVDVTGLAWFDREWSSSVLGEEQTGWDWFALHLNDGRDLMYYRLRDNTPSGSAHSYAVLIDAEGNRQTLSADDITHRVTEWWRGKSGSRYPVAGVLQIPSLQIRYQPLIRDQEMQLSVSYWEGSISLADSAGRDLGVGYLELTGY